MSAPLDHEVGRWVEHWADVQPEALAWADDHRRCDYATAAGRIRHLAGWLHARGVGPGDRIALWMSNRAATLEALFAAARLGAIVMPVNARLTAEEVAFQLEDSTPKVLLVEHGWQHRARQALARMEQPAPTRLAVGVDAAGGDAYETAIAEGLPAPGARSRSPEDPTILMYTSGTTGKPKGALLPLRKTFYNCRNAVLYFDLTRNDRVLVVAPLFHSLGLQILSLPAIFAGAGLVVQGGFDPLRVWQSIEDERITYYGGVPTMHQRMLDALVTEDLGEGPLASLRFAFTAGSAAPAELIRSYHERGLPMIQGYGQTETSILTCLDAARSLEKAGSVGRPVHHARLRLVDPATVENAVASWRDVGVGEVGEVVVSGPITMLGYWQRPEATSETLRDEWLRTGDLATRDDDGDLTLVGRAHEMYISGGENVYPAEVEATLVDHPDVEEAAVVAVADPEWGEVGHAHLVPAPGCEIVPDAIFAWLGSRLARYKQPRRLIVHGSLPRTASGKVQKHLLDPPDS